MHSSTQAFIPLNICVLTISDTRTLATDTSGQALIDLLESGGHRLIGRSLVNDCVYRIRSQVSQWIADDAVQVILTTGGTGFTGRDNTPEAILPLLDKLVDGWGETFRQESTLEIGTAGMQSRAFAGLANATLICCLPGSPGACRLGWKKVIAPQLDGQTRPCNFIPHLKPQRGAPVTACESRT